MLNYKIMCTSESLFGINDSIFRKLNMAFILFFCALFSGKFPWFCYAYKESRDVQEIRNHYSKSEWYLIIFFYREAPLLFVVGQYSKVFKYSLLLSWLWYWYYLALFAYLATNIWNILVFNQIISVIAHYWINRSA